MVRRRLIETRGGVTKKVAIGGKKIYITANEFEDGTLGEIFLRLDREGEELRVYDLLAIAMSVGLQHGVPLATYVEKFKYQKMEPAGFTSDPDIPNAGSVADYLVRWLELRYADQIARECAEGVE